MDPVMGPGLGSGWNGVGTLIRIGLELDADRISFGQGIRLSIG